MVMKIMSKLALLGGEPLITKTNSDYISLGTAEIELVNSVLESQCLSGFFGGWCDGFYGGPKVQEFESEFSGRLGSKYAISVNSNTSGLIAAIGAAGISPGDEVIVPPFSMSATAMAPLFYGGIPVFVDIESDTFCLNPELVNASITDKTRAIIAVNLFGHPAQLKSLRKIADKHGIILIEDNAQAPFANEENIDAGTIGHMGVFSFNYHKHIHTGEGGMVVTNDELLAKRLYAIRNHGENVVEELGIDDITNMIGFNFRMTELSAAVGLAQLKHADKHINHRIKIAERLTSGTEGMEGIIPPIARENCKHVYYCWAMKFDQNVVGVSRELFIKALVAEGFTLSNGYVKPLYMLPVFQSRKAIGRDGFPFNMTDRKYKAGICEIAERMHTTEMCLYETCAHYLSDTDLDAMVDAFNKVYSNRNELLV